MLPRFSEKLTYVTSSYIFSETINLGKYGKDKHIPHIRVPINILLREQVAQIFKKICEHFYTTLTFKIQTSAKIILQRNSIVSLQIVVEQCLNCRMKVVLSYCDRYIRRRCMCSRKHKTLVFTPLLIFCAGGSKFEKDLFSNEILQK